MRIAYNSLSYRPDPTYATSFTFISSRPSTEGILFIVSALLTVSLGDLCGDSWGHYFATPTSNQMVYSTHRSKSKIPSILQNVMINCIGKAFLPKTSQYSFSMGILYNVVLYCICLSNKTAFRCADKWEPIDLYGSFATRGPMRYLRTIEGYIYG